MDKEQILKRLLTDFPDAIRNDVTGYTSLKVKKANGSEQNFVQVSPSNIAIISRFLTEEEQQLFTIAPKSYAWTIDADFKIRSIADYERVLPYIRKVYEGVKGTGTSLNSSGDISSQHKLDRNTHMTSQVSHYTKLLKSSKNLILRGAPGTGKSYLAKQIALELTEGKENQIGFVQFHPSYDYTDFVDGLRPILTSDNQMGFERRPGVFKAFCQQALIGQQVGGQDNFLEVWQDFFNQVNEAATDGTYDEVKTLTGKPMHLVAYERSGMTGVTEKNSSSSLFFNMEQCYKVYKGLPGVPKGGFDTYRKAIVQHLKTNFGLKDYQPPTGTLDKPFVFIIDEINRGEISKIFGELFFSIDPGYRGKAGAVTTQYSNMTEDDDLFYVPENVYIIGTMNDIDRSVDTFDFAMRRRFRFVEVKAQDTLHMWEGQLSESQIAEASRRLSRLNRAIEETEELNRNYHIGPAYFLKLRTDELDGDYRALWQDYLEPLLEEYLRGTYNEQGNLVRLKAAYDGDKEQGDENNRQSTSD